MDLRLHELVFLVFLSGLVGAVISRYFTAKEWRVHCEMNDTRWYKYNQRLIDEDLKKIEEKQLE